MVRDGLARAVLDALPDATAVVDHLGTIMAVNKAWRMFAVDNGGRPDATGVGVNYLDLCARSAAGGCTEAVLAAAGLRAVLNGKSVHAEIEYPCPSPAVNRWFLLRITPLHGESAGAVASHVNITRRKMAERALAHQAAHDPLTGLANHGLLAERLSAALTRRPRRPDATGVGLLFLDVDGFKRINDSYGHEAGDEVLLTIAHRIRTHVRPQDTVARPGGDEFVVVAPRIGPKALDALAARVRGALSQPHVIHGHPVRVLVSIGSHLAALGDRAEAALRCADQAMYAVKHAPSPAGR